MKLTAVPSARRRDGVDHGPPDFVGVGAQRAGTGWWFRLLTAHPSVESAPRGKELHFFERYLDRRFGDDDVLAYHQLFSPSPGITTGEWTPRYMHDFWTPALLAQAAPRAKILVMLRDPWERYRSGLGHERRILKRALRRKGRHYVRALMQNDSLSRSLYSAQVSRLLEHFDRSQLLLLQYERCVADPARELRRTYAFIGVDPVDHQPELLTDQAGRASPRSPVAGHLERAALELMRRDARLLAELAPEIELSLWPSCQASPAG